VIFTAVSNPAALKLLGRVRQMRGLPPGLRPAQARKILEDRFDQAATEKVLAVFRKESFCLRGLCQLLFLNLFAAIPFLFSQFERWPRLFLASLASGLALFLAAVLATWLCARRLHPENPTESRKLTLATLLSPLSAIRAVDILAQELAHDAHPVVMGRLLLKPEDFQNLARKIVLELRHPDVHGTQDCPGEMAKEVENALLAWLEQAGVDTLELMAPPSPSGNESRSYCPRCQAQYVKVEGKCADCGLKLTPF
jgi:hypothetical protein